MNKVFIILFLLATFQGVSQEVKVATYNIRFNNPADGANTWENRVSMVTSLLNEHAPDVVGLQEALIGQIHDIKKGLPGYGWIGVGRDDGKKAGEFSPIFYKEEKLEILSNGTFWLNQTPEKPGLGWDAACNRVCTWAQFRVKSSGKMVAVFNTHFDHVGVEARKNSVALILGKVKILAPGSQPVVVMGDFNLPPEAEPIKLLAVELSDSRQVTQQPPKGPLGTFNGFNPNHPLDKRIDYIFVNKYISVVSYHVPAALADNRYPSDHLPVVIKAQLK